jgi:hypothetical protein
MSVVPAEVRHDQKRDENILIVYGNRLVVFARA